MKTNYHTHTVRCKHAKGSDEAYVLSAIKAGFNEIGFADHCPWPFEGGFVSPMRMELHQLEDYVSSIRHLREKYQDQIKIKIGLEVEYFEEYIPWLKETVEEYQLDYLIFGNHFPENEMNHYYLTTPGESKKALDDYLTVAIKGMESKLFTYFAHPDVFMRSYPSFDEHCEYVSHKICEKAKELDIPLEYNLAGYRNGGYPHPEFWKIAAKYDCQCIIGVDAHEPNAFGDGSYERALEEVKTLNLRLIHQLDFNDLSKK